jgi:predicted N-acetyltransferase YhbS
LLATHEDYQRRRASKLVKWGMEMASEDEKAAVVIASSSGRKAYLRFGFKLVSDIHIQLEGEEAKMDLSALVYAPDGGPERTSKNLSRSILSSEREGFLRSG